jgi:hypothetical protein
MYTLIGIAWHGIWMTWYDTEKKKMCGYRVNQISLDGTEDSEAVAQNLAVAVKAHVLRFSLHTKFILETDGAGAYAGGGLLARLGYFFSVLGVECVEHSIGEPGGGKTPLDGGFGTDKAIVRATVLMMQGRLDAVTADALLDCLHLQCDTKGIVISYMVTPQRNLPSPFDWTGVALRSASLRAFEYDEQKRPSVNFFRQSGLNCAPLTASSSPMDSSWNESVADEDRCPIAKTVPGARLLPTIFDHQYSTRIEKKELKAAKDEKREERIINKLTEKAYEETPLSSAWYHCPRLCNRIFCSESRVKHHLECQVCTPWGPSGRASQSTSSSSITPGLEKYYSLSARDITIQILQDEYLLNPQSFGGSNGSPVFTSVQGGRPSSFEFGWAIKTNPKAPPMDKTTIGTIEWSVAYGEIPGNTKISPDNCHIILEHVGEEYLVNQYPDCELFCQIFTTTGGTALYSQEELIPSIARIRSRYGQIIGLQRKIQMSRAQTNHLSCTKVKQELFSRLKRLEGFNAVYENDEELMSFVVHIMAKVDTGQVHGYGMFIQRNFKDFCTAVWGNRVNRVFFGIILKEILRLGLTRDYELLSVSEILLQVPVAVDRRVPVALPGRDAMAMEVIEEAVDGPDGDDEMVAGDDEVVAGDDEVVAGDEVGDDCLYDDGDDGDEDIDMEEFELSDEEEETKLCHSGMSCKHPQRQENDYAYLPLEYYETNNDKYCDFCFVQRLSATNASSRLKKRNPKYVN